MAMRIAEITITVNFKDGESTVFTLDQNGLLCPTIANGVAASCQHWLEASRELVAFGLRSPDPDTEAQAPNGNLCWPWME